MLLSDTVLEYCGYKLEEGKLVKTKYEADPNLDTKYRVGTILIHPLGTKFLIGRAPNHANGPNQWDLVGKGHIQIGDSLEETINRETLEECGLDISKKDKCKIGTFPYSNGTLTLFSVDLEYKDDIENIFAPKPSGFSCSSYFEWYGKQLPEFEEWKWIEFSDYDKYLYKSLVKLFDDNFKQIENCFTFPF